MVLYFEDANYQREKLCESKYPHRLKEVIRDYLKHWNYKSPYWRYNFNCEEGTITIDVGSHSEFFIIEDCSKEDMKKWGAEN